MLPTCVTYLEFERTAHGRRLILGQHLEETQEEVQVQVRRSRRSSRASTEQAPSSPSVKVDEQGRLRTWSGPEKLGPIAKAASEKDIFRSFSVWSDGSTPTLVSSKSQSSCQTSNSRSTSKASVTSSRKLFSLATSEASSQGGASVAPQLSPCNPDSAVILVDWDDTLCPTSWVFDQIRRCPDNKALAAVEKASAERLEQHCAAVVAFLRAARAVARVAIVTLATEDFFHQSAETFLESAHIKDLFVELGIEVHFAERPTQMTFPAEIDAKKKAMNQCLSKAYAGRQFSRWNVMSVGDSEIELEALKRLLNSKWRSPLCKTLKFDARPSLPQLTAQLRGVTPNLPAMMAANKSFHITSHTKWP